MHDRNTLLLFNITCIKLLCSYLCTLILFSYIDVCIYTPRNEVRGGILESPCPSVRLSVRPSVCRRAVR